MPVQSIGANTVTGPNSEPADSFTGLDVTELTLEDPTGNSLNQADFFVSEFSTGTRRFGLVFPSGISNIPAGSTINSANLKFYIESTDSIAINALKILTSGVVMNQATWNNKATATAWNTAGALGSGTDFDPTVLATSTTPDGTQLNMLLDTTFVSGMVNSGASKIVLRLSTATATHFWQLRGPTATDGLRPRLIIDFTAGGAYVPPPWQLGRLGPILVQ